MAVIHKILAGAVVASLTMTASPAASSDWGAYGGDAGGQKHSTSSEITPENVKKLKVAWTVRTGELGEGSAVEERLTFEATPILAEGRLYVTTLFSEVIAIDPATGKVIWRHDPKVARSVSYAETANRGASSWIDTAADTTKPCRHRIFVGTLDGRMLALDGASGAPCTDFGSGGAVDLKQGVRLVDPPDYTITSPPVIAGDLVITGSSIGDNRGVALEYGIVRALDARTGAVRWAWDPIPRAPGALGREAWDAAEVEAVGAGNAWPPLSYDGARGIVYVPTGSASPDFFGGERKGDNRFANSLVALRAQTGEVVWWQQLVHHDLWDFDLPAQPVLADLDINGRLRPAVIQATKMGIVFTFDRETGEPIFGMEERPVPQTDVPGEESWPTQPFPLKPRPLTRTAPVGVQDAFGLTPFDAGNCRDLIRAARSQGIYTPPSLTGTLLQPGYIGGMNWGGLAFDPKRQIAVTSIIDAPTYVKLIPRAQMSDDLRKELGDGQFSRQAGTPYVMFRKPLVSWLGMPCIAPPWGKIVGIDMKTGEVLWETPLGTTEGSEPFGLYAGVPGIGGAITTAAGLTFIGNAMDGYLRAFASETGKELWKARLPAGGQATPMSYSVGGRQFVVIAAGGHGGLGTKRGDYLVAFALPE